MNVRKLWQSIMDYGEFARMPVSHWKVLQETHRRWISEGMPENVDFHEYFNTVPMWKGVDVNMEFYPCFEEKIIEETHEYLVFMDRFGVIQKDWKNRSTIPHYLDHTFKTASDWDNFKKRLQPDDGRIPDDIDDRIRESENSGVATVLHSVSFMGWIRNWMGVENMSYMIYDNRDVYKDIIDTLADLACWAIDKIVPMFSEPPDMVHTWEDICGKNGPLVSPLIFRECVGTGYLKVRNKLDEYGIKYYSIDSDGLIEPLIKDWMDSGVNIFFPLEIGTWNSDPVTLRKQYGKEFRVIGGFNKLTLEKGPSAINAELESLMPVMKEGGFCILPDHLITPGTSLADYKYYLEKVRGLRF